MFGIRFVALKLALAASNVVGGTSTTAIIALATAAPSGGTIVTVTSPAGTTIRGGPNQVSLIGTVGPISIRVPAGQTQVSIGILTGGVATTTQATITAKSGTDMASATLTIRPASLSSMSLSPATVTGGQQTSLRIVLDGAAPGGTGVDVPLSVTQGMQTVFGDGSVRTIGTSITSALAVPATAHFPPGTSSLSVPIATTPVSRDQTVTINALLGVSSSTTLIIKAPIVAQVTLASSTVLEGQQTTGTVTLNGAAPSGFVVPVATSRPDVTVTTPVVIPAGATTASFTVSTSPTMVSGGGQITALVGVTPPPSKLTSSIADGTSNTVQFSETTPLLFATPLVVLGPVLESFALRPTTVKGGANVIGSLKLLPSVTSATVVALTRDHPELVQVPSSVTVPSSPVPTPFTLKTLLVTDTTKVQVTATANGQQIVATLTIVP